ncbi:sushi domain-containing protein 2-like [Diadema setosum]|uniref:sushi domain-containing protein 2-like n=1 Tax=Diadema setosum TaxID=31175 RepID=UPI003B3A1626
MASQLNDNGVISFDGEVAAFNEAPLPIAGRFIAVFWADIDPLDTGSVSHFQRQRTDGDADAFEAADEIVRQNFAGKQDFETSWMYVCTWDMVRFSRSFAAGPDVANSFQVVLLTDGQASFAILNYESIIWTTGDFYGGDLFTGLGGNPAKVGFNKGDGATHYSLEGSGTDDVVNIDEKSNVGEPGRFVFRIDGNDIIGAELVIVDTVETEKGKLTVSPLRGTMLGGTQVFVRNAVLNATSVISCTFDNQTVRGRRLSDSDAVCVTPTFFKTGRIPLAVSFDGGTSVSFRAMFTLENVGVVMPSVISEATSSNVKFSQAFNVSWDVSVLQNVSDVDVVLFGYKEDIDNGLITFEEQIVLVEDAEHDAGHVLVPNPGNITVDYHVGIIGVLERRSENATTDGLRGRAMLWGEVHVLQWLRGTDPVAWCNEWDSAQGGSDEIKFMEARQSCPCSLSQARLDTGSFRPLQSCSLDSDTGENCTSKAGAIHCVVASIPSVENGGQECCYGKDGNIMNAALQQGWKPSGGLSYLVHQDGVSPFQHPGKVPFLSHFIADVLPLSYCCTYQESLSESSERSTGCASYIERRPSQVCDNYEPPSMALGNGDPHITTLDMKTYTFNGHGEFLLLQTLDGVFTLQSRTRPFSDTQATVFVAIAAQCIGSDVIHVELVDTQSMDVYVRPRDGDDFEKVDFEQAEQQTYDGVSLTGRNISDNGVQVVFNAGVTLQLKAAEGALSILLVTPRFFRNNTRGLMGSWNGNPDDDFTTSDGRVLSPNLTAEEIHFEFGLSWNVSEEDTLFYYPAGSNHSLTNDLAFTPVFQATMNPSVEQNVVEEVCQGNSFCTFDFQTTGSQAFAQNSLQTFQDFEEAANSVVLVVCPPLTTPTNGNLIASRFTEGGEATFTCSSGYQLSQNNTLLCLPNATYREAKHHLSRRLRRDERPRLRKR